MALSRIPDLGRMPHVRLLQRAVLPGGVVNRYSLAEFWAVHLYLDRADLTIGVDREPVRPGTISFTPPGVVSVYRTSVRLPYYCIHFSAESFAPGPAIPAFLHVGSDPAAQASTRGSDPATQASARGSDPAASGSDPTPAPAALDRLCTAFDHALAAWPIDPLRSGVRVWDLLLDIYALGSMPPSPSYAAGPARISVRDPLGAGEQPGVGLPSYQAVHPALQRALAYIERNLSQVRTIKEVADAAGLSPIHASRLFRQELDDSIAAWIRRRRLAVARYQLAHSTKTVKSIAAEVGILDLHAFNKLCRDAWGLSPRELRKRGLDTL